ncbi:hypothetical protein BH11CYA1_BH11CYA1_06650 [soil metagenome]
MTNNRVSIGKSDLVAAAQKGAMATQDVDSLWSMLQQSAKAQQPKGSFDIAQLLYYAGGVLVMMAMGWFLSLANDSFGMGAVVVLSAAYTAVFAGLGYKLRFQNGQRLAGAVLFLLAVLMVPFTVASGLEYSGTAATLTGLQIPLILELCTLVAGCAALRLVKVSILSAPVFGSLWLLTMTLAGIISGDHNVFFGFGSNYFTWVSVTMGAVLLASATVVDSHFGRDEDYSWWGYLFGVAAFWIPLSLLDSGSELSRLAYFGINVLMMLASVVLARKVFLLAGSIGAIFYVGHLLWSLFSNSILFPFALVGAGIGVILLGVQYRRHKTEIENVIVGLVPQGLRQRLPGR